MRPLTSSNFSIEGMLLSMLIRRRAPQNPCVMVTACTGTLRSFANGDLSTNRTPSSLQSGLDAFESCKNEEGRELCTGQPATAAAEMAEPTNWRRENREYWDILTSWNSYSYYRTYPQTINI